MFGKLQSLVRVYASLPSCLDCPTLVFVKGTAYDFTYSDDKICQKDYHLTALRETMFTYGLIGWLC